MIVVVDDFRSFQVVNICRFVRVVLVVGSRDMAVVVVVLVVVVYV